MRDIEDDESAAAARHNEAINAEVREYYYLVKPMQWVIVIWFITIWSMTFKAHQLNLIAVYLEYNYLIRTIPKFIITRFSYREPEQISLVSAAFYIYTGCTNVEANNNIFVNTRDESPYCASAIYDYNTFNLNSDYNDLYYDNTNSNNCLVKLSLQNTIHLQTGKQQVKTFTVLLKCRISKHLIHIVENEPTLLESRGIPIAGITTDFDGDQRNADSTDIGADGFDGIPIVGVEDEETLPTEFVLEQNFPNPFNPITNISYSIPSEGKVGLIVYDILGENVQTIVNEIQSSGKHIVSFNGNEFSSGVDFYRLNYDGHSTVKKMMMLK